MQISLAGTAVAIAVGVLLFGPIVRSRIASEAGRRKLEIDVGSVRPGWFSVRLGDVKIRLQNVPGIEATLPEVRVELSVVFRPREIVVRGGTVAAVGTAEDLGESLRAWRGDSYGSSSNGSGTRWRTEGVAVVWKAAPGDMTPLLEAKGVAIEKGDLGYRVGLEAAKVGHGKAHLALGEFSADFDPRAALRTAKAARAQISYDVPMPSDTTTSAAQINGADPAPPPLPVALPSKKKGKTVVPSPTTQATDEGAPLLPLPDLHALRQKAAMAAAALASRVPEGSLVAVDGLELELAARGDKIALGPGPFSLEHRNGQIRVSFATGDAEPSKTGTRLSLEGTLPLTGGDVLVQLSGGPVALSLLGVKAGAMGLTDVERATMAGKGRVVVSAAGDSMTFDVDVKVRGMAINNRRLALDTVRGLDFAVGARGLLTDKGELRLDDAEIAMGALRFQSRGGLQQHADHVAASLTFDVPAAACQMLLDSIPTALIPTLRGARMAGTFGARGRLAFDTRKIDDLVLEYAIADACRMTEVPADLSHDRFARPFTHRIYLSDGKLSDETTGPGTPGWTDLDRISPYMQVAVLTTEDGAFMHHKGFNHAAIKNSLVANLKARRFLRGASTITMQLAKNLFLSREKTLSRKLEEVILTDYLEQILRKEDMMELYLNIIEFGPNIYGVTSAAEHYFGRKPEELNLAECLFLSSIMPAPVRNYRIYEKGEVPEAWMRHVRQLMEIAEKNGKISKTELAEGLAQTIVFHANDKPPPPPRAPVGAGRITGEDEASWQQL